MKLPDGWSRARAAFDDDNLVSCAGLVPVMALAERTGLSALVEGKVAFNATSVKSAGANPAGKITAIIAGMAAGADNIDDLNVIRAGGMPRLFAEVYAPATLGFRASSWRGERRCRSQAEVARAYGVSPGWVSMLVARYRAEGEVAFAPRSRRPKTSPTAITLGPLCRRRPAGSWISRGAKANRIRTVPGRSTFRLGIFEPLIVSTRSWPRSGLPATNASMACITRAWVSSTTYTSQSASATLRRIANLFLRTSAIGGPGEGRASCKRMLGAWALS